MDIKTLLNQEREIWGNKKMTLEQIIPCIGKIFGDICKLQRDTEENKKLQQNDELKKEFGNLIASSIRWCDDLNYDPEECINLAINCQKKFPKN